MSDININASSLPARCEICHQSDCFDAEKNYCARCADTAVPVKSDLPPAKLTAMFQLKVADIMLASTKMMCRNWFITLFAGSFMAGGIYFLSRSLTSSSDSNWITPLLLSVFLLLYPIALLPLALYIGSKRLLKSFQAADGTMRYTFDSDGFEVSVGKIFSQVSWDSLWRAIETSDSFLLYQNRAAFNLVPKRGFNNPQEISMLREIIRQRMDKKASLLDSARPFYSKLSFNLGLLLTVLVLTTGFSVYQGYYNYQNTKVEKLYWQAYELAENSDYEGAERLYKSLVEQPYHQDWGYLGLANCRMHQKDLAQAEQYYKKALEIDPTSGYALTELGKIAFMKKDFSSAEKYFTEALKEEHPGHTGHSHGEYEIEAHHQLAMIFYIQRRFDEAARHFKRVMALDAESPRSDLALKMLTSIERLKESKEDMEDMEKMEKVDK